MSHEPDIALFGYYRAAVEVARVLDAEGHTLVIVDEHEDNLAKAEAMGFATARLDFRDDDELMRLGLGEQIHTVFSLFPDDAENVFLTISARALARRLRIVSLAHDSRSVPKLIAAGADKIIDTHEISGREIWQVLRYPLVNEILHRTVLGSAEVRVAEIEIPGASFLDGRRLGELDLRERHGLVLLGVVDRELGEHFVFSTEGFDHRLDAGDVLVVIARPAAIDAFRARLAASPG